MIAFKQFYCVSIFFCLFNLHDYQRSGNALTFILNSGQVTVYFTHFKDKIVIQCIITQSIPLANTC